MKQADIAVLLALANGHDQRHGIDDVKVQAWHALFTQECPDMPQDFAARKINEHYAKHTDMLMPAHLVSAWKKHKQHNLRPAIRGRQGTPMPDWLKKQIAEMGLRDERAV